MPRLGKSFSVPSVSDYGYRITAHQVGRWYEWKVWTNDHSPDAPKLGVLARGNAWTIERARLIGELAVRGLPRSGQSWPDNYRPLL